MPEDTYGSLAARLERARRRAARARRSTSRPGCAEQDEAGATYAEKITAEDRLLDPARPAVELERRGACADPPHRRLDRAATERAGGVGGARRDRAGPRRRRAGADGPLPVLGCAEGELELLIVQPAGRREMERRGLASRPALSLTRRSRRPARACALRGRPARVRTGRLRRSRAGRGGRGPRAARPSAGHGARLRDRSAAPHARPRRRPAGPPAAGALDPPVLAALRLGLLPAPLPGRGRRPRGRGRDRRAGQGRGPGGRRAGQRRTAPGHARGPGMLAGLSDDDPGAAAIAHSVPPWLAELWWRELGGDEARALLAASTGRPRQRSGSTR